MQAWGGPFICPSAQTTRIRKHRDIYISYQRCAQYRETIDFLIVSRKGTDRARLLQTGVGQTFPLQKAFTGRRLTSQASKCQRLLQQARIVSAITTQRLRAKPARQGTQRLAPPRKPTAPKNMGTQQLRQPSVGTQVNRKVQNVAAVGTSLPTQHVDGLTSPPYLTCSYSPLQHSARKALDSVRVRRAYQGQRQPCCPGAGCHARTAN